MATATRRAKTRTSRGSNFRHSSFRCGASSQRSLAFLPEAFAHALVTEYRPGTPIGWHRDAPHFAVVAGVSLAGSCVMRFRPRTAKPRQKKASWRSSSSRAPRTVMQGIDPLGLAAQHTTRRKCCGTRSRCARSPRARSLVEWPRAIITASTSVLLSKDVLYEARFRKCNPDYDPAKPCVYVGMTGLSPDDRFDKHKAGNRFEPVRAALRAAPDAELYECYNPMPY
jgi:hypothetical protein